MVVLVMTMFGSLPMGFAANADEGESLPIVADVNSLIITEIELGGVKHRFLLDTGAGANFLSPDLIKQGEGRWLKRREKDDQTIANATEKVQSRAYTMDLKVGRLDFGSLLAFEQDTRRFTLAQDGIDCCSGILGIEFLKKFPVEIDRARKRILLKTSVPEASEEWAKMPVSSPNGRVVLLQCKSSLGPETLMRLDTGSEAPLIIQKRFIDRYSIVERVAAKSDAKKFNGLPLISFGAIQCAEKMEPVSIDALAYIGPSGALTHAFVDGNIGGAFLGSRYVLALAQNAIYIHRASQIKDVRMKDLGPGTEIALTPARMDEHFRKLRFDPIQERIREGLGGLDKKEHFAVAQLLLSAASASNKELGFKILNALERTDVPCIDYYRAEMAVREGRYEQALKALSEFQKTKPILCEGAKRDIFQCCPDSKYRNATGLKVLSEWRLKQKPVSEVQAKLSLSDTSKKWKVPLVTWKGKTFLVDTGAEHHVWNTRCASDLGLKLDSSGRYGGADSVGEKIVATAARPQKEVLGLSPELLSGFAMDLGKASEYGADIQLCGVLSPQQVIPEGLMVLDWSAGAILLCQGEACRKSLEIPANCPMYMFNGRPYFNASVNGEDPRLFLLDSGANSTSVNRNYFVTPPKLEKTNGIAVGASQKKIDVEIAPEGVVSFCGANFKLKPLSVRPSENGWEWSENGKIGMNLLYDGLIAVDFGRGGALFR